MDSIRAEIRAVVLDPSGKAKINRKDANTIDSCISQISSIIMAISLENSELKGELGALRVASQKAVSFAEIAAMPKKGSTTGERGPPPISAPGKNTTKKPKKTHSILVSLQDKQGKVTEDAEEVKKALMGAINPATEKIRVKNIRKTRNGKVLIETESQADLEKLKDHIGLQEKGIIVSTPAARVPRLIIYDVPMELCAEVLPGVISEQNPELLKNMGVEDFKNQCKFKFKLGPRDRDTTN